MDDSRPDGSDEIKIVDRRKFTAEGERRSDAPEEDDAAATTATTPSEGAPPSASDATASETTPGEFEHTPIEEPEGVDFTLLINAMAQPAVILLDEVPHDDPRENQALLERARIQIDLLDLLRVKCRGNLAPDEERLLDQVLYQLRMLYVQKRGGA